MASESQLAALTHRIDSLRLEIKRVSSKDHPYAEPRLVYDALLSALDARAAYMSEMVARFRSPSRQRFLDAPYETVAADLSQIVEIFSLVDRVDSSRIPFEILRGLSWTAQELVGRQARVVVRLDPITNYSLVWPERVFQSLEWTNHWKNAVAKTKSDNGNTRFADIDILLLGIPSAYAQSILVNALAAHEMGHLHFEKEKLQISNSIGLAYRQTFDSDTQHRLHEYVAAQAVRDLPSLAMSDAYGNVAEIVRTKLVDIAFAWCTEVYSDLLGARLLGPAFTAAFDRILVGKQPPSETHPPTELRRSLIAEYIVAELPEEVATDPVWEALVEKSPRTDWRSHPIWAFEERVCRAAVLRFHEVLRTVPSPFEAVSDGFTSLLKDMQEHIYNLSPPSVPLRDRLNTSEGIWAMFYAAWHFRLDAARFGEFVTRYKWDKQPAHAEAVLGNLLLQGLTALELNARLRSSAPTRRSGR